MARPLSKAKRPYTIQVRGYNAIKKTREYLKVIGAYKGEFPLYEDRPLDPIRFFTNSIDREEWLKISRFIFSVQRSESNSSLQIWESGDSQFLHSF